MGVVGFGHRVLHGGGLRAPGVALRGVDMAVKMFVGSSALAWLVCRTQYKIRAQRLEEINEKLRKGASK